MNPLGSVRKLPLTPGGLELDHTLKFSSPMPSTTQLLLLLLKSIYLSSSMAGPMKLEIKCRVKKEN